MKTSSKNNCKSIPKTAIYYVVIHKQHALGVNLPYRNQRIVTECLSHSRTCSFIAHFCTSQQHSKKHPYLFDSVGTTTCSIKQ